MKASCAMARTLYSVCRHVSLADFSTWLCLGLKLIEDCSSAGLLEWPFQNKFFIGEINI